MFEVGDKVRFVKCFSLNPKPWGKISTILEVRDNERQFPYIVSIGITGRFPTLAYEIEKVAIKGQQLLFSFMSEAT